MKQVVFLLTFAISLVTATQPAIAQDPSRFCGGIVVFADGVDSAHLHSGDVMLLPVYLILANPISRFDLHFKVEEGGLAPVFFVPCADLFSESEALRFEMTTQDRGLYVSWVAPSKNAYTLDGAFLKVGDVALQVENSDHGPLGDSQFTLVSSGRTLTSVDSATGHSPDPLDYLLLWPDNTDLNVTLLSSIFGPTYSITFEMPQRQSAKLEIFDVDHNLARVLLNGIIPAGRWSIYWNTKDDDGASFKSGIYYYRFESGSITETKQIVVMK